MPLVQVRRLRALTLVGLDRPHKRNALDQGLVNALHSALDEALAGDPSVLVLHSTTPGMFVAGADIAELVERRADAALRAINAGLFERIEEYRWPTIAAVDGVAYGGGCELAMSCDFRLATPAARFAQPELSLGIMAGAGGNWRLSQLVGQQVARRMLFAGAVLDAETALAAGLVDGIHPPDRLLDAALALGETIGERSWRALELTKLALRLHRPATTVFDVAAQALLFESDDKISRMQAFLNRVNRPSSPNTSKEST